MLVLLSVLTAVVIGPADAAQAIAHGEAVGDGQYQFAVKLTMTGLPTADGGRRDSSCSGGLISPHWVLTAGHCFRDTRNRRVARLVAKKTTATVGRADLTGSDGHQATVVAVRQSGTADIALVKLDQPITDVVPLQLSRTAPPLGQKVRLTGYGLTSGTATRDPSRLRTGRFAVSSVDDVAIGLSGIAPSDDTSPCRHDSGGPYFTEKPNGTAVVVAVVSHGPDCPHTGADIGGRIDTAARWILSIVGKDLAPSSSASTKANAGPSSKPLAGPPQPRGSTGLSAYPVSVLAALMLGALMLGAVGVVAARRCRRTGFRRGIHRRGRRSPR